MDTKKTMPTKSEQKKLNSLAIDALCKRYPRAFNKNYPPLKIGIHADLIAICKTAAQKKTVRNVMFIWTANKKYLKNLANGGDRVGLDGKKTGIVSDDEMMSAKNELERIQSIINSKKANKTNDLAKKTS